MRFKRAIYLLVGIMFTMLSNKCFCQISKNVSPRYTITLDEAHIGSLKIDSMLLDSYGKAPLNSMKFYLDARKLFKNNKADFTDRQIVEAALNNDMSLMGGPMLGDITENGVSIWLRPSNKLPIHIKVNALNSKEEKDYTLKPGVAGKEKRIVLKDLSPSTKYTYVAKTKGIEIAEGTFRTSPKLDENNQIRLAFGSGFHKIGLHNPNLINTILQREPNAMLLLGDIAVDDRENNFSMHRSDYLLRDVSNAWKKLASNIPVYASWDDHDYLNNDLSGVPKRFTEKDREELRTLWRQNWNNPQNDGEGIYFSTRIGQVELIMLDTRSCRTIEKRGQYGSYLGTEQLKWFKDILKKSTAHFKVVSSGTMWSDYVSNGKDSWGTWDTMVREEIFNFMETENIPGVLLISGDRHGARGFTIPRKSGFKFYEFEAASLGGVPGPDAMAKEATNQIFGYGGKGLKAFGEFTFNMEESDPQVVFRLIDEFGNVMEQHTLLYDMLTPRKQ
ncbi:alkaline phosphatase D family protein [Arenibacter sp. F20364]|uniref:alkaline phosphatase D family protein n=1 Tax=Arenibacter sp. F20364 TaxID=2926415 RepID=UPI001FF1E71F|nr:alkaline phosphatase D family protein [Arenibacter sp. F20364]MCK0190676.1 alkaline phosphatase D family protein [Arenibacter sp. F20364]